ncbi:MAG: AAA family ATPase, partial [Muribaculaceae bacterium]|nr:AAA family ATPase [Muribaculaceae bacterium]
METVILRPHYLRKIMPYVDKGVIKVLTGQRRVGKSFILKSVADEIRKSDAEANFIFINLEDFAFSHIKDSVTLNEEISKRLSKSKKNYIFLDEVQEVEDFDKVVRSLNLNSQNDIYVTGSNSAMLSS